MVAYTDYASRAFIDWTTGKAAMPATGVRYLGLFTGVGTDAGTGFTEVTGGSYARIPIPLASWNAAAGSAPSSASLAAAVSFPVSTAPWGTVIAWGLFDALTVGNEVIWDYLGNFPWLPFVGSSASPSVLTVPAHGFANGDSAVVTSEFGGILPATAGSWAGLLTVAGATTDSFNLGVNTTGTGSGSLRKVAAQSVPNNVTVKFDIGGLTISQA